MAERTHGRDIQQNSIVSSSITVKKHTTDVNSNVTDVFKTPGKLRGKTPRTARKRNLEEARVVSDALK